MNITDNHICIIKRYIKRLHDVKSEHPWDLFSWPHLKTWAIWLQRVFESLLITVSWFLEVVSVVAVFPFIFGNKVLLCIPGWSVCYTAQVGLKLNASCISFPSTKISDIHNHIMQFLEAFKTCYPKF